MRNYLGIKEVSRNIELRIVKEFDQLLLGERLLDDIVSRLKSKQL